MDILYWVSTGCMIFVAWFTCWGALRQHTGGQTPADAMVEAWTNLGVGFSINFMVNIIVFPLIPSMGHNHISGVDAFMTGWIYTAISIVRQYVIRRWHNWKLIHGFTWRQALCWIGRHNWVHFHQNDNSYGGTWYKTCERCSRTRPAND